MVGGVSTAEIGVSVDQPVGLPPIKDVAGLESRVLRKQAEVAGADKTAQAKREIDRLQGTPAEGMDLDPRYKTIEGELERVWLETHPDKDWFSGEAQDYRYGTGAENAKFISDAEKLFRQRYPEDAAGYDAKEPTRIYEQSGKDPAIKKIEQDIRTAVFNDSEVRQAREGKDPNKYREAHFAVEAREARNAWDEFIRKYPEKAKAYGERGHTDILKALERQGLQKQEQERQAEILAESKAEDTDPEPAEAKAENADKTPAASLEKAKSAVDTLSAEQKATAARAIANETDPKKKESLAILFLKLLGFALYSAGADAVKLFIPSSR